VHINSGIPNKAFYLTATGIGGNAWEAAGHIWYESVKASSVKTVFQDFANTTFAKADQLYGRGSAQQQAVLSAWREVGVNISGLPTFARAPTAGVAAGAADGDTLAALTAQIQQLSAQVKAMAADISALRKKK
jgi:hypothetical protein